MRCAAGLQTLRVREVHTCPAALKDSWSRTPMSPIEPQVRGPGPLLIRHEGHTPRERSACGWRDRLISHEDAPLSPAAWAHAVDIDGAKLHYHKRSTELYYVLDGSGSVILDGAELPVAK